MRGFFLLWAISLLCLFPPDAFAGGNIVRIGDNVFIRYGEDPMTDHEFMDAYIFPEKENAEAVRAANPPYIFLFCREHTLFAGVALTTRSAESQIGVVQRVDGEKAFTETWTAHDTLYLPPSPDAFAKRLCNRRRFALRIARNGLAVETRVFDVKDAGNAIHDIFTACGRAEKLEK